MIRLTEQQYRDAENFSLGYCTECENSRDCCEPDAEDYLCEECGTDTVQGILTLLMTEQLVIVEE